MSEDLPPLRSSADGQAEALPFRVGHRGPGVADLQQRLARLGYRTGDDPVGTYGAATERTVRTFQVDRGLRADGVCGVHTWSSVVEAGFALGDRQLYRRSPMLHGDDVAELQRRLSALGFDPGGLDGIFGDQTAVALSDFQHNIGISSDGICGRRTLAELSRLSVRRGGEDLVTAVREQLRVGHKAGTLQERVIVVGEPGGFQAGAAALVRALSAAGAHPVTIHHPDESEQAEAANTARADCYIGLRLEPGLNGFRTAYYRGYRYESAASKQLAHLISERVLVELAMTDEGSVGMALPVLRQTRMPAVVLELGRPATVAMHTAQMAAAITSALADWLGRDWS
ncbi:MAG: peptidoglycan-binding protein [Acidimicrobiales bacterium]